MKRLVALWPERWPLELMQARQAEVGPYNWASQYQGEPRPPGGRVFEGVAFWEKLPDEGLIHGFGLDLAYSAKRGSDWSVLVHMARLAGREVFYVLNVVRKQMKAPDFKRLITSEIRRYPGARVRWYGSGTEKGSADFFAEPDPGRPGTGLPVDIEPPQGDKGVRALPVAAAWADRRVLVPANTDEHPWVNDLISELLAFTGLSDPQDDQVDALAAAYDELRLTWVDKFAGLATM